MNNRDRHGRRVYIDRVGNWDPNEVPIGTAISAAYSMIELLSLEPKTQIAGVTCVSDAGGYSYKHMTSMSMKDMRNMTKISEVKGSKHFKYYLCDTIAKLDGTSGKVVLHLAV